MSAMQSMERKRTLVDRRRLHVRTYDQPTAPRWDGSWCWGGRYNRRGALSRGIGFQVRIRSTVVEVIAWPRWSVLRRRP